jgi:ribosomal protein S18 acetylase RimI-like enzyme
MILDQIHEFKDGIRIEIVSGVFSDDFVRMFLETLDVEGKNKFRHVPDRVNEFQYFALTTHEKQRVVGYGAVYPKDPRSSEACLAIAVHQDYRGIGLGKMMYQAGEELAMLQGKRYFRAETDADNEPAIATMRSLGWEIYGPIYIVKKIFDESKITEPPKQRKLHGGDFWL